MTMKIIIMILSSAVLWSQPGLSLDKDSLPRLKIQRSYSIYPSDRTMQGKIYRSFPERGISAFRPRPNFANGYQTMSQDLYRDPKRRSNSWRQMIYRGRIDHRTSRALNRTKTFYRKPTWQLRYYPFIKPNQRIHAPDTPFR